MIRLLIVDDHAIVRQGLEQLFATTPDIEVIGTAADGQLAVDFAREQKPDVILMDLGMPTLDGVGATRQIVDQLPLVRVVVLTSYGDESRILDALNAGAHGYLLKHSDPDDVIEGVRVAYAGDAPLDPRAGRVLIEQRRRGRKEVELTPREREVLGLVGQGMANKQIARRLEITERTVKAHLTSVFQRIGVTDRVQAALWARQHLQQSQ
jgi:DNA-binding NarL/FixJ family response regulator